MWRSEEPNMGLPVLECEFLLLGYIILQMAQRKKCDPERMKAVIEAIRNKEMGRYKASRILNVPQTKLERYVKDRKKSSSEIVKTKLGRKQVLSCEAKNYLTEHSLLMERRFFVLTMADVTRLAYQLAMRYGIKNRFCKRN
jgi:hypothetical protein